MISYKSSFDETQVDIDIDNFKKYGIMLSGGLDSAILLYSFIKLNPQLDLKIFTIPKHDGAKNHALSVVEHFNKKFNLYLPEPILVGDFNAHHRMQSKTAVKEIFEKYQIDHLYIGINKVPPELKNINGAPDRSPQSIDPKIVFPFHDLLKSHIIDFMYQNEQEDLIEITHSCTEKKEGRCGICWQCTERAWAFSQLNKTDTGSN